MQLSQHFTLQEFTRSDIAVRHGFDNTPDDQAISNLRNLCNNILEPLRTHINSLSTAVGQRETPIIITSGFRSPSLNKAVGGVRNSQHMTGEACDIHIPSTTIGRQWFLWLMDNTDFDQLIFEHNNHGAYWIHVSCKSDLSQNRHQVLHLTKSKP